MAFGEKLGYANVPVTAGQVIKAGPAGLFGITATTAVTGTITIYDNASAASGTVLYSGDMTLGQVINFGGNGIAANNGLYAVLTTAGVVNVLYT